MYFLLLKNLQYHSNRMVNLHLTFCGMRIAWLYPTSNAECLIVANIEMRKIISMIGLLVAVAAPSVQATPSPATLHIGSGYDTPCQNGGCPLYNGEVNNFDAGLDIYQNSGGASALDPVLLIFGVPNTTSVNQLDGSEITQAFVVDTAGAQSAIPFTFGTTSYGLGGNGYIGNMTAGQEVYSFIGLGANNSNSFTNWSQWDLAIDGITATNFGIYVFAFDTGSTLLTDFAAKDYIDVLISGLPKGTYAVAYGQDASGKAYSTPFTEAGLVDDPPPTIPEPMTLALMGIGLAGVGLNRRKKMM